VDALDLHFAGVQEIENLGFAFLSSVKGRKQNLTILTLFVKPINSVQSK